MNGFKLRRLGMIMEPEPGNPNEVGGVLNPGAVRGPDGELYLFPRLVAKGNYSRIGIARVRFNDAGDPAGVERLGIALELLPMSFSLRASIGATILELQIVSTYITAWPTIGLVWRALTCQKDCRQVQSSTHRRQRCKPL